MSNFNKKALYITAGIVAAVTAAVTTVLVLRKFKDKFNPFLKDEFDLDFLDDDELDALDGTDEALEDEEPQDITVAKAETKSEETADEVEKEAE